MAYKTNSTWPTLSPALSPALKTGLCYGLIGGAGLALSAALTQGIVAASFLVGFLLGALNHLQCYAVARRAAAMEPELITTYVSTRFYLRFVVTATIMALLVAIAALSPWAIIAGFTASLVAVTVSAVSVLTAKTPPNTTDELTDQPL